MDSLKTLMDKRQYDLVLKITENSQDALSLFYRLSALLAVGKSKEALALIKDKRLVLQTKPALLMKIHIEILCMLGMFDEAYNELKYYQELPYENQETEELLNRLPQYIREEEVKLYKRKEVGQEEITKKLLSKNDNDVLSALDAVRNENIDSFILPILNILKSYPKQTVRAFALLLLVSKKYDKKVSFLHFGQIIEIVPSELKEPFIIPEIGTVDDLSQILQDVYHDPSLVMTAVNLISSYIVYLYPTQLPYSQEELIAIFSKIAKDFMQIKDDDFSKLCQSYELDEEKLNQEIIKIKEALNEF